MDNCKSCGLPKELFAKGMCSQCYYREYNGTTRREKVKPATCHPDRPTKARGMCAACYQKWYISQDPERKRKANTRFREWAKNNPEKMADCRARLKDRFSLYQRNTDLRRHFGIEPEQYEEMLASQGGCCAICGMPETANGRKNLSVDHCHTTGLVRGLLCSKCNHGIGQFNDSVEVMKKAILYLEKQNGFGLSVPVKT